MEPERHLLAIRHESAALADAARRGLGARVPSCPDWDVAALVGHVGHAYRWVTHIVRTHADAEVRDEDVEHAPGDGVIEWFEEATAELVEILTNESPDSPAWNWSERDMRTAWWMRRMANEVAVHRWDGQLAHGVAEPVEPELAVDGVDELLVTFLPHGLWHRPREGLSGTALVEATDTGDVWTVTLAPDRSSVTRERGAADATLRASASDLLLAMWGRDVPLEASGDERLVGLLLE